MAGLRLRRGDAHRLVIVAGAGPILGGAAAFALVVQSMEVYVRLSNHQQPEPDFGHGTECAFDVTKPGGG